jgi:hypothetical protein
MINGNFQTIGMIVAYKLVVEGVCAINEELLFRTGSFNKT